MRLYALDTLDKVSNTMPYSPIKTDGYKLTHTFEPSADHTKGGVNQNARGKTLVHIPSAEIITQRLETYVGGAITPYLTRKLYPRILKMAGSRSPPFEVAVRLILAMHDACEGLPPMIYSTLSFNYPELVLALVPDETLHAEILAVLNG